MPLHPRAAAAVRTAALACAFAAAPGSARGDGDFQARAEEQYSHLDSAGSTSDLLGQRYLLGFGRQISPPIHYRLRLDYLENRDHVFTEGDRFLLRSLSPGLKLDYAIPDGSGQLRYDVRWLQQGSPAGTSESWLHQAVLSATARLSEID